MNKIAAASNLFSALNPAGFAKKKMGSLISEVVTNGVKALNTKEPVAPVDRIEKHIDGQAGRFERIFAAHTRAHAVDEMVSHLMSKKDTNGDGMLNIEELGVSEDVFAKIDKNGDGLAGRAELSIAARTHAALNNMISEILPPEKSSKLDATV
jgi:hypothetical protein